MDKSIRLLIVEDDEHETKTWKLQIDQHNVVAAESNGFTLRETFVSTKKEAIDLIANSDFDAAIVDLGLATGGNHKEANSDGNDVVEALEKSELAIVIIYTGQPGDAISKEKRGPEVVVIAKLEDGDGSKKVLARLTESAPMILTIRAAEETIKSEMAALFSKSIWPRWKFWLDKKVDPDAIVTEAVTRHMASHVYAALLAKNGQKALSEEWYFVPPVRQGLRTGDLVDISEYTNQPSSVGIVITPRCDLADNPGSNKETYQIAVCEDISADWNDRYGKYSATQAEKPKEDANKEAVQKWEEKLKNTKNSLGSLIQHRSKSNCHFLHQMRLTDGSFLGPYFVRFDKIMTIERQSENGKKLAESKPFASVAPEFLPSLVERLGTYFSRIGTPDFSFFE